jgi:hypothetical protein
LAIAAPRIRDLAPGRTDMSIVAPRRYRSTDRWPDQVDPCTICLTVDVEWVADPVLAALRQLLDERGLRGTFFCTHAGVDVGPHERGLHPNYRRGGDQLKALTAQPRDKMPTLSESEIYRHILGLTRAFAPEAKGARSHSLYYDSLLIRLYHEFGLEYDSTYLMPLVAGLRPFWKEDDVLELPIYFNDHFELKTGACNFDVAQLGLERPGLKIINLHPNMIWLNCDSDARYQHSKAFYHDVERLTAAAHPGRGIRSLVIDLLDRIVTRGMPTMTLGEINTQWRAFDQAGA